MLSDQQSLFLDAITVAGLCGALRYDEQRIALLKAYSQSTTETEFLNNIETFGVARNSLLFKTIADFVQCPAKYQQASYIEHYKSCSFIYDSSAIDLMWPVLTERQMDVFRKALSEFKLEYSVKRYDSVKKLWRAGRYAGDPTDNKSVIPRFQTYIMALTQSRNKRIRAKFEGLPVDMMFIQIGRAYDVELNV